MEPKLCYSSFQVGCYDDQLGWTYSSSWANGSKAVLTLWFRTIYGLAAWSHCGNIPVQTCHMGAMRYKTQSLCQKSFAQSLEVSSCQPGRLPKVSVRKLTVRVALTVMSWSVNQDSGHCCESFSELHDACYCQLQ